MVENNLSEKFGQAAFVRAPLEKVWEFEAAEGIESWMGPVASYDMVFFPSKDGAVYALEAVTGQPKWTFKMGKRARAPLVVTHETIYVVSDDKNIYAIDARTGQRRWQFSTGKDVLYRPVVANGIAYVTTKDKTLYALDAQTGVERWRFSPGKDISPLEVGENMVFFGSEDQCVYALDATSGAKRWEYKSGHKKHSPTAIGKGKVLISGDDDLYAININDGALSWVAKKVNHGWHTPIVEGALVLCTKELTILNLADGSVLAKMAPGQTVFNITVRDGTLYASIGGTIFANDLYSKQLKWYAVVEPQLAPHMPWTLGEESVFMSGYSKLYAINTSRLMKRWEVIGLSWGIDSVSAPAVTGEMLAVSCGKRVFAFRSSKDPVAQRRLEIGAEFASTPKYTAVVLLAKEGFMGGKGEIFWPNCCCLCCGPVEKRVDLMKKMDRVTLSISGIP
jgi:outer membrane protein assembly factor BamB